MEEGREERRVLRTNSQEVERATAELENDKTRPLPGEKGFGRECDRIIRGKLRVKINLSGAAGKYYHCNGLSSDQHRGVHRLLAGNYSQTFASTLQWLQHVPEQPKLPLHTHHRCLCCTGSSLRGNRTSLSPQ